VTADVAIPLKAAIHEFTFSLRPAEVRPCYLLLDSPVQARAGYSRRCWLTYHEMRAHMLLLVLVNHPASDWSEGVESVQTHSVPAGRLFPSFVQMRPVFIPPSSVILILYRLPGIGSLSCRERSCRSNRQGKVRERQAWKVWTWLKNLSGSMQTPYEQVVNSVTA
jgi:hypothetical protein